MEAKQANLLTFLQRPNQFVIPIYQRTYSWSNKQCVQLWADIVRVAKDAAVSAHFLGSIVYVQEGLYHVATVPELLVIDGQQRLATLSLLLAALGRAIDGQGKASATTREKISNYYLFNSLETGEDRYRLLLTKGDKDTLIALLEDRDPPVTASSRLTDNFRFFEDQIKKSPVDLDTLYRGIGKLVIVDIALDRTHDNPQLIFESLNSTGMDLSQADLIRNYVLMGCDRALQTELYEAYWYPMEQSFGGVQNAGVFDRFIRDFLTIETGQIPNIGEVYESFKVYAQRRPVPIRDLVARVYHYSKLFVKLAFGREDDTEVAQAIADINSLRVEVAFPFLMEVLEDQSQGLLSKAELVRVLRLVESYVFRRAICGIPTNSLNKTFAGLAREILKTSYVESVEAAFLLKDSYKRMPRDEEFRTEFMVKDLYHFPRRNYVLRKLENYDRKEYVDVEAYTIEHVMPQNPELSFPWQEELGPNWRDLQTRYLHTIGNLTLTGYNPELSDRPFKEKQTLPGGFKDSPIRLNRSLANQERWTEQEIQRRASTLADLATKIWMIPELEPAALDKYRALATPQPEAEYTVASHTEHLKGQVLDLFEALRKRILNLDASVREEPKKYYIAYKNDTNFVDIVPQKSRLLLTLNMRFSEVKDPQGRCRDVTNMGRWGNGDVEVALSNFEELDYTMSLVQQSWETHTEHNDI